MQRSLRDVAAEVGITNTYLSQLERGVHQPSIKVLRAIADALHLPDEHVLHLAGWIRESPQTTTCVINAVHTDARLTAAQRTALLDVYKSFVGT